MAASYRYPSEHSSPQALEGNAWSVGKRRKDEREFDSRDAFSVYCGVDIG
jgi:hypothetical protein